MSEAAYLEEKLDRLDPEFQLTRRFVRAEWQEGLGIVHALRCEFRELPLQVRDPSVAMAKLGWWQEEWQRLESGEPRHPVTTALSRLQPGSLPPLTGCLHALSQAIEQSGWDSFDDLIQFAEQLATPLAELEAVLCGTGDSSPLGPLWRDIQMAGLVLDLPAWWSSGRLAIPLDVAAGLQIRKQQISEDAGVGAQMLQALAERVLDSMDPPSEQPFHATLYHDLSRSRMQGAQRIRPDGEGFRLGPGPIRRLLVVWNASRRVRRQERIQG